MTIVAIGSSSTAGEGGIKPYPAYLQDMLRQKYGNPQISVINKGVGGQEAPDELQRMQDVIDARPALTIWQVGTNAVWKGQNLDQVDMAIKAGLQLLRKEPMDVILMDLQYAPAILAENRIGAARRMQSLIMEAAVAANVSVFRRFDMMRKIVEIERRSFDALIDPGDYNRLHESDMISGRIGYELCQVIAVAATVASPAAGPEA
ncbi:MAG TPA: SGNH/GDSL hydrolase family protein [Bradyrhizobium sp.]|nr:SGNH/GDSL hydrolase family protein [Bradyrhizobium sp.]